jgi:hypothetical protein
MFVMLLWVYIHTGQAWKVRLATVGIEPTTFGMLARKVCHFGYRQARWDGGTLPQAPSSKGTPKASKQRRPLKFLDTRLLNRESKS